MLTKYEEEEQVKEEPQKYEASILGTPIISEKEINALMNNISLKTIRLDKVNKLGLKRTAYGLQGYTSAYYCDIYFLAYDQQIVDLERYLRQHKKVLKYIIIKEV